MKIRPVGAQLFHATGRRTGRQRDMTDIIISFGNFANESKS